MSQPTGERRPSGGTGTPGTVFRTVLGVVALGCAVVAIVLLTRSTADYIVLAVGACGIVFGSAAVVGRHRTAGVVRTVTACGVTLACLVMVCQVGLSMAGMFGHDVPGYSYNSAHRPLTDAAGDGGSGAGDAGAGGSGDSSQTSDPADFSFPSKAKTQTLTHGVKISTALRAGKVPDDAQPTKYAGKSVAMVYVRIKNTSAKSYSAGYPATYCRYDGSKKCYDVFSQAAELTGVEPFNEKVAAGKTKTFRLAFAVPKKQLDSFDLRLTLDGAANNPYIVRG